MQWQHPAEQLPKASLAAMHAAGPACSQLLASRVQQWRDALRGVLTAWRHGHCPVVYIVGCQVSEG